MLLVFSTAANTIKPPRGFHGTLYKSTLVLYGQLEEKKAPICTATVFEQTSDGYLLLSAGHCVMSVPLEVTYSVADDLGQPLTPVKIVKAVRDEGTTNIDFAVFELKTKKHYTVIPISKNPKERIGDKIVDVNFSEAWAKQVSEGKISSVPMGVVPECDICENNFMVQLYASSGASGSAIVSEKTHEIIGLLVGGEPDANIGAIVEPISRLKEFQTAQDEQGKRKSIKDVENEEEEQ